MKKFTKFSLITALVLFSLGIGICIVSVAMGGGVGGLPIIYSHNEWGWRMDADTKADIKEDMKDARVDVQNAMADAKNSYRDARGDWDDAKDDWDNAWDDAKGALDEAQNEWDDAWADYDGQLREEIDTMIKDVDDEILLEDIKEDLDKDFVLDKETTYTGVRKLDIEVNAGSVQFIKGDPGDQIKVRYSRGDGELQISLKDTDTLDIEYRWRKKRVEKSEGRQIQIIIPEGYQFDEVEININAGLMIAEELKTNKLELEINAGMVLAEQVEATKLDADCKAGRISLDLNAAEMDYNYKVNANAGVVTLGEERYGSLHKAQKINNPGATGEMELECSAGEIAISFNQE